MSPELIGFLTSDQVAAEIRELVDREVGPSEALAVVAGLRRTYGREQAAAIFETALLRQRAREKFTDPSRMLFDREALEQATAQPVARWRAQAVAATDPELIVDLGCGIGGDALELTRVASVIGVDIERSRLRLARHNTAVAGGPHPLHPVEGDSSSLSPIDCDVVFADPARRSGGRRIRGLDSYLPPVGSLIERWRSAASSILVKVAPGITDDEIPAGASVEWVSYGGDLREAVVALGDLRAIALKTATVLPAGISITGPEPDGIPVSPIGGWLLEPDAAVIRAGLVRVLASEIGASMIDPAIAYLTSDRRIDHPMLASYPVDEVMPFNLKRLRRRLAELDVGSVSIKKRGSPITPEQLRPRLRLEGERSATIFLTRVGEAPVVALGLDRGLTS